MGKAQANEPTVSLYCFGDSVFDNAHFVERVAPHRRFTACSLLVKNEDDLFPGFAGADLDSLGSARHVHLSVDGATVDSLESQLQRLERKLKDREVQEPAVALVSVGGNDLLIFLFETRAAFIERSSSGRADLDEYLSRERSWFIQSFSQGLHSFMEQLPIRPALLLNVYDPSYGRDENNFLGIDEALIPFVRQLHGDLNREIEGVAESTGATLVDLHSHFLKHGDSSWNMERIEPSPIGTSEIRRILWPHVRHAAEEDWAQPVRSQRQ